MFKNPFFYGERGCLWYAIEVALAIFAVGCIITGEDTRLGWAILISDAVEITMRMITRLVNKKLERERYYREDSFWLRKDDEEDT
jgi:hypothetical protein